MRPKPWVLYFLLLVSLYFVLSHWVGYLQQPLPFPVMERKAAGEDVESFWFDLVVNKNISVIEKLPATGLHFDSPFWLQQLQRINEKTADERVEALSAILQLQLEERLEMADCSKLTLNCGHSELCGLGCHLHHIAFCVMMSFALGIPLIHDPSNWPFKSPWETYFKRIGSTCTENEKTVFLVFDKQAPHLSFSKLCAGNTCYTFRRVRLSLNEGIPISTELLDLLGKLGHTNPFLWYMGQFIRYCLRFNNQSAEMFKILEKSIKIGLNPPVVGIQARRTDKTGESAGTYRNESEYMEIAGKYFQDLEQHVGPKTIYLASEDHMVLPSVKKRFALPGWKILGFESNVTLPDQRERSSDYGLLSIICRLILETMATRFYDADSRCHSVDGNYSYALLHLEPRKLSPT